MYSIRFLATCFVSLMLLKTSTSSSPFVLSTEHLPEDRKFMASIGNGYVGTVVMGDTIHVAGIYNGRANVKPAPLKFMPRKRDAYGKKKENDWVSSHTHRARIPSTIAINFTVNFPSKRKYYLDMYNGKFMQTVWGEGFFIQQQIFAHRNLKNLLCNKIFVDTNIDLRLKFHTNKGNISHDFNFENIDSQHYDGFIGITKEPEYESANQSKVAMISTKVPEDIFIKSSEKERNLWFLTSIVTDSESNDPYKKALDIWSKAYSLQHSLIKSHSKAWNKIWENGRIEIDGDEKLEYTTIASLYNLYSSISYMLEFGISPGGLPISHEYLGHVFWDQEMWMFPPILMLQPRIGKRWLDYRFERLESAKAIARKYGFKGAMFPWESAVTGLEVCPDEVYGRNEIHITGDIVFAFKQYFYATQDTNWLKTKAFPVIYEAALFWESRVRYVKEKKKFSINNVMPPDEYQYPVNNSVYTNILCKKVFEFAIEAAEIIGQYVPYKWRYITDNLFIPYNKTLNYHPEFEGFDITDKSALVKQADVILVNYPLLYNMKKQTKINDLTFYENITDANGPAMTHSMFTIGWLDVDQPEKADKAFEKTFENIQPPFYIWSETKGGGGASNFLTGAGGYLQSLINGYFGIRLMAYGLKFEMRLPAKTPSMTLYGLKYLRCHFNMAVTKTECLLIMVKNIKKQMLRLQTPKIHRDIELNKMYYVCKGTIVNNG